MCVTLGTNFESTVSVLDALDTHTTLVRGTHFTVIVVLNTCVGLIHSEKQNLTRPGSISAPISFTAAVTHL